MKLLANILIPNLLDHGLVESLGPLLNLHVLLLDLLNLLLSQDLNLLFQLLYLLLDLQQGLQVLGRPLLLSESFEVIFGAIEIEIFKLDVEELPVEIDLVVALVL